MADQGQATCHPSRAALLSDPAMPVVPDTSGALPQLAAVR
jgi:hypothetical protein